MPEPEGFDVKKVVEKATSKITVNELQRRGVQHVKVLDEKTLHKLIKEAVENILMGRSGTLSDSERQRIYEDSRKELERLMAEFNQQRKQQEVLLQDKNALVKELENLQRQIELTKKMYEERLRQKDTEIGVLKPQVEALQEQIGRLRAELELAKQKSEDPEKVRALEGEVNRLRAELEVMRGQAQEARALQERLRQLQTELEVAKEKAQTAGSEASRARELEATVARLTAELSAAQRAGDEKFRLGQESQKAIIEMLKEQVRAAQESADRKYAEGVKSQEPMIQELKERIQSMEVEMEVLRKEKEEKIAMQAEQNELYKKLEELASKDSKAADKLSSLVLKTIDGLTRKINSLKMGTGGVDEVVYTPNEQVLENLLRQELESNIGGIAAQTTTLGGSKVDDRISKLKNIRASFGGGENKPKEGEEGSTENAK